MRARIPKHDSLDATLEDHETRAQELQAAFGRAFSRLPEAATHRGHGSLCRPTPSTSVMNVDALEEAESITNAVIVQAEDTHTSEQTSIVQLSPEASMQLVDAETDRSKKTSTKRFT